MESANQDSAQAYRALRYLTPVRAAFAGSVFLSLIAVSSNTTLNRDGMLYVDTARVFLAEGLTAAVGNFAWPSLSILMAMLSHFFGLDIETSGHMLNVLFMAGACSLLVASSLKIFPDAGWSVCLTLLAIPGLNDYRNELLREYGCWFFVMLSLWIALRWAEIPQWRSAVLAQSALLLAALFRPEALVFLPALIVWQVFEANAAERAGRLVMIGSVSILALVLLAVLFLAGMLPSRLVGDFSRLSAKQFSSTVEMISPLLPGHWRENFGTILFFGSLAIVPVKFVKMFGLFTIPLLYAMFASPSLHSIWIRLRVFAWAFIAHLLVVLVFVVNRQFLAGRYVVPLLFLLTPLAGYGMHLVSCRFPRWRVLLIVTALLLAAANVVSTSPGKQHFVEAGNWLASNVGGASRVYNESARAAYYAGWRYRATAAAGDRGTLRETLFRNKYDFVILEMSRTDPVSVMWLNEVGLKEIRRFTHPSGDAVVIAIPESTHEQAAE